MAWTYSDWLTSYSPGTASRVERLRLHVKEVSDQVQAGDFSIPGLSASSGGLLAYRDSLLADLAREEALAGVTSQAAFFTEGRPQTW